MKFSVGVNRTNNQQGISMKINLICGINADRFVIGCIRQQSFRWNNILQMFFYIFVCWCFVINLKRSVNVRIIIYNVLLRPVNNIADCDDVFCLFCAVISYDALNAAYFRAKFFIVSWIFDVENPELLSLMIFSLNRSFILFAIWSLLCSHGVT